MRWLVRGLGWLVRARAGMPVIDPERPQGQPEFGEEAELAGSDPVEHDTIPTLAGDPRDQKPTKPPSKYPPGRRPPMTHHTDLQGAEEAIAACAAKLKEPLRDLLGRDGADLADGLAVRIVCENLFVSTRRNDDLQHAIRALSRIFGLSGGLAALAHPVREALLELQEAARPRREGSIPAPEPSIPPPPRLPKGVKPMHHELGDDEPTPAFGNDTVHVHEAVVRDPRDRR